MDGDLAGIDGEKYLAGLTWIGDHQVAFTGPDRRRVAGSARAGEQVGAHQLGDVPGARVPQEIVARADLGDPARLDHHDPVAKQQRFQRTVGHVEGHAAQRPQQVAQLATDLPAGLEIERGERLVQQQ